MIAGAGEPATHLARLLVASFLSFVLLLAS
jgi:hypothetical protein